MLLFRDITNDDQSLIVVVWRDANIKNQAFIGWRVNDKRFVIVAGLFVLDEAVDDAVRKAKVSAEFFDAKLGPVYSVNYGYSSSYQNYGFHNDAETIIVTGSRIDKKDLVQWQYLEAQITFTESVNVIFDLIVD